MDEWEEFNRTEAIEHAKEKSVLDKITILMGKKFRRALDQYLKEFVDRSDYLHSFDIVYAYRGKRQKIDIITSARLPYEWVNQYENGGYCGDSYAGQVWIPLKGGRFFTFHYSM